MSDSRTDKWETITVPAGEFRALRVRTIHGAGPWSTNDEKWYAPSVRAWVRYKYRATVEDLVSFTAGNAQ
jgi:hypothetical protein